MPKNQIILVAEEVKDLVSDERKKQLLRKQKMEILVGEAYQC